MPCSIEGVIMRRRLTEQGVAPGFLCLRKAEARVVSDHRPRPSQMMGAALDGWTWTDEGQRHHGCPDRGEAPRLSEPGRRPETRDATSGAPEGAPAANPA